MKKVIKSLSAIVMAIVMSLLVIPSGLNGVKANTTRTSSGSCFVREKVDDVCTYVSALRVGVGVNSGISIIEGKSNNINKIKIKSVTSDSKNLKITDYNRRWINHYYSSATISFNAKKAGKYKISYTIAYRTYNKKGDGYETKEKTYKTTVFANAETNPIASVSIGGKKLKMMEQTEYNTIMYSKKSRGKINIKPTSTYNILGVWNMGELEGYYEGGKEYRGVNGDNIKLNTKFIKRYPGNAIKDENIVRTKIGILVQDKFTKKTHWTSIKVYTDAK